MKSARPQLVAGLIVCASAFVAISCLPQRHEYLGAACNDDHPCPSPLFCAQTVCIDPLYSDAGTDAGTEDAGASDAGPSDAGFRVNLFPNPSFETTGRPLTIEWETDGRIDYDLQVAHTGISSLKLDASTTEVHSTSVAIAFQPSMGVFCVEAWLNGSGAGTVSLAYTPVTGAPQVAPDRPEAHATLSPTRWVAVRTRLNVDRPLTSELRLTLNGPAWVDDVAVWHSPNTSCDER